MSGSFPSHLALTLLMRNIIPQTQPECERILAVFPFLSREFDTSFFSGLMQLLYLSHFRLIFGLFLSNFMIFIVLFCTLCGIIKKTKFFLQEKSIVYVSITGNKGNQDVYIKQSYLLLLVKDFLIKIIFFFVRFSPKLPQHYPF